MLLLAAESPFEGERDNAIEAATRLAAKHGMSLHEAAKADAAPPPPPPPEPPPSARARADRNFAAHVHMGQSFIKADKERREQALKDALDRGLDRQERRAAERGPPRPRRANRSKRNGVSHASILLRETTLPLKEVADLSGLDIYQVVGMKLKMRVSA